MTTTLRATALLHYLWFPAAVFAVDGSVPELVDQYIHEWQSFAPSAAFSEGFVAALFDYEDLSPQAITEWIAFNQATLDRLQNLSDLDRDDIIDRRLLRTQILKELDRWSYERQQETSLELYSRLIADALEPVLDSPVLSTTEKARILLDRLAKIEALATHAEAMLRDGRRASMEEALESLAESARFIETDFPDVAAGYYSQSDLDALNLGATAASSAIRQLANHVETELLPSLTLPDEPILGRELYARKLAIYTDSGLTPERLEEMALAEIAASKQTLEEMARAYWREIDPLTPVPNDFETLVGRAFDDMENNRPTDEQSYLLELREYGREVMEFVRGHDIATVPEHQTLSIELAPPSSGPMARIGYVDSAPPFDPNPWTTWYLATIPDSYPDQERIDFWRSFNYSFKRFIVIHELFPGHYMQLKILRGNPHKIRILFPYRPFIEGWATFTERIVLDAGYAEGDWLTRFAQVRKRLENANRALMSVRAHCQGWSEAQVTEYSIETSLLAPQFAASLWGRLMRSPMQIITYMLVGIELREIYESEVERLGDNFDLKGFMDTILRAGPVPSDELRAILDSVLEPALITHPASSSSPQS